MLFYHLQEPGRLSPRVRIVLPDITNLVPGGRSTTEKKPMEENRQQDKKLSLMEKWDTTRVLAGKAEEAILSLRKHKKRRKPQVRMHAVASRHGHSLPGTMHADEWQYSHICADRNRPCLFRWKHSLNEPCQTMNQGGKPETNTLLGFFYNLVAPPSGKKQNWTWHISVNPLFQDQNNSSRDIIPNKKQPFSPASPPSPLKSASARNNSGVLKLFPQIHERSHRCP